MGRADGLNEEGSRTGVCGRKERSMWLEQREPSKNSREFKVGEQHNLICVFKITERHDS